MKIALIFLGIVAYAAAAVNVDPFADRSLSSTVQEVIEGIRDQMPCGFPGMGIPPLAPLKIAHRDININTPALQVQGSVDNFKLNGLNDFDVVDMRVNPILSKVNFRFNFRNVNVDTLYDLSVQLQKAGFTVNIVGKGPAKFAILDMDIWGSLKYSLGVISGKLKLKSLDFRTHIGAVESNVEGILGDGDVNAKVNAFIAEFVETAVNENEDAIAAQIEQMALPVVNSFLDTVSLADIISGSEGEKEACIPPAF